MFTTTEEEMEGPISFWGYKERESNLILPEHDDIYIYIYKISEHIFGGGLTLVVGYSRRL